MHLAYLILPLFALALAIHGCSPVSPAVTDTSIPAEVIPASVTTASMPTPKITETTSVTPQPIVPPAATPEPVTSAPESTQSKITPAYQKTTLNGVTLSLVSFDDRDHQLRVADQPDGPGSQWITAQEAAAEYNGIAAINAGFFTPEGKPLGILVENSTRRGSLNSSSLGAGMIHFSTPSASIFRKAKYSASKHHKGNLIQTGPMLAENNSTISGLSKTNSRHRSFIAWDGDHHWIIGYASPCTLSQLSEAIAGKTLGGVKVHTAINLDGGRSSDLWVGNQVRNGGKTHRTFINKTVRNYLVLVKG